MATERKPYKPTANIIGILKRLAAGEMLVADRMNLLHLGDDWIADNTRRVLVREKLVTRLDKTRNLDVKGNGFVLSDHGRRVLQDSGIHAAPPENLPR